MEESIQFISNIKGFVSVKKMKIAPEVTKTDIVEFLAAIQISTNTKIKEYLEQIIDINKLIKETEGLMAQEPTKFFTDINSSKTKKIISSHLSEDMNKDLKDAIAQAYIVYLTEKYLITKGFVIGYHGILFPARKKQLKKVIGKN